MWSFSHFDKKSLVLPDFKNILLPRSTVMFKTWHQDDARTFHRNILSLYHAKSLQPFILQLKKALFHLICSQWFKNHKFHLGLQIFHFFHLWVSYFTVKRTLYVRWYQLFIGFFFTLPGIFLCPVTTSMWVK